MIKYQNIRYRHRDNLNNEYLIYGCKCTSDQHREKRIASHSERELKPAEALQSVLFHALEGCSGLMEEHSFLTRMVVATGGDDIDVYEGSAEEMEPLFRAAVLRFLFYCPVEKWCDPGYGYKMYFELLECMGIKAEAITERMKKHFEEHGYVKEPDSLWGDSFKASQKVPAKFVYMLMRGVTSEGDLFSGIKIKKEDDFVSAVELHLEFGTPLHEIVQEMNLAVA